HYLYTLRLSLFFRFIPRPPIPTLFPYTTLFRSPSDAARPRQRLHPHGPPVGVDARGDHRAEARRRRYALRVREPRDALRRDPLAAGGRRALLALGGVRGAAAAPGRCLRRRRGDLLARGVGRAAAAGANIGLTSLVPHVLNGDVVKAITTSEPRGGAMSA